MDRPGWLCAAALIAIGCQTSVETPAAAGTAGGGSTDPVSQGGNASVTPPASQPLGGPRPITCNPAKRGAAGRRLWRLTRAQYDNTVALLLGDDSHPAQSLNPEPGSAQGFQNDAFALRVRATEAAQLQTAAHHVAVSAVSRLSDLAPCVANLASDPTCGAKVVADWGRRLFRRPLTESEQQRYLGLFQLGASKRDGALGVEALLEAMLQSPHFLYRSELGPSGAASPGGSVQLTPHELATLLSYTFVAGPPDTELNALADAGGLAEPAALQAQARRLLATPAARPAQWEFHRQLFELNSLADIPKDASVFPEFETLRADLEASAHALVEHTLFEGAGKLSSLLTSNDAYVNQRIAPLFGLSSNSTALELAQAPAGQHPGLLGHPAVMSVLAARTRTSPVNRGRFVLQRLLCQSIPDPPAGVDTQLPALEPGSTARQQLDARTSGQPCSSCHGLMNPIGYGFESLDGIGRYRTTDNAQAIDDSGSITGTRDADGAFRGVAELAAKLSASAQVHECLAVQGFRYALGRPENEADACAIVDVRDHFTQSGLDLKELFVGIAASEAFRARSSE